MTYYPPPWAYYWLYDWVPWPFWWGGFGFGGFFVLGDFDGYYHGHHFSNHFRNANGTFSRVDPATRARNARRRLLRASPERAAPRQGSRLNSPNARAGATALVNRSTGTATGTRTGSTASASRSSGTQSGRNLAAGGTGRTSQGAEQARDLYQPCRDIRRADLERPLALGLRRRRALAPGLRPSAAAASAVLRHRAALAVPDIAAAVDIVAAVALAAAMVAALAVAAMAAALAAVVATAAAEEDIARKQGHSRVSEIMEFQL